MSKIVRLKMLLPAGNATPTPPLAPALGQRGVKAMDFCKLFNERTKGYVVDIQLPTYIAVNPDRTFNFTVRTPQTSWLIKKACGIEKGGLPGKKPVASISVKAIYEIAKIKQMDRPHVPLESICRQIVGSARSMSVKVVN